MARGKVGYFFASSPLTRMTVAKGKLGGKGREDGADVGVRIGEAIARDVPQPESSTRRARGAINCGACELEAEGGLAGR